MNFTLITNEQVGRVAAALEGYSRFKHFAASPALLAVKKLTKRELWLLSFVNYFLTNNRMWSTIDASLYHAIPTASEQEATFKDFIDLLRHYSQHSFSTKTEKALIVFLQRCTEEFKTFYMGMLSRSEFYSAVLSRREVKAFIDPLLINSSDIYSKSTLISEGFDAISYPFTVSTVDNDNLVPAMMYKNGPKFKIFKRLIINNQNRSYRRERVSLKWLNLDRPFIYHNNFVLVGMMDYEKGIFYPQDYFDTPRDYLAYKRRKASVDSFPVRLEKLSKFLDSTLLRQIRKLPMIVCQHESELIPAVSKALESGLPNVCLADQYHRSVCLPSHTYEGLVGSLWIEHDVTKGLIVWHSGRAYKCPYDFTGGNAALLYNPKLVLLKPVKVTLFEFRDHFMGSIKEILWEQKPYRREPYVFRDGTEGYIERCPICLRADVIHHYDGLCANTAASLRTMMGAHGVDNWFLPSPKIRERRQLYGWHPDSLNNSYAMYKGYRIVANAEGELMFKSDPELRKNYEMLVADGWNGKLKYFTPEEVREAYVNKYQIKGGAVGEVLSGDRSE